MIKAIAIGVSVGLGTLLYFWGLSEWMDFAKSRDFGFAGYMAYPIGGIIAVFTTIAYTARTR